MDVTLKGMYGCGIFMKRVCMDVASLSTLKCSSEKGMYGCGIFIDLKGKRVCMDVASLSTL